jgi:hypothetical protein
VGHLLAPKLPLLHNAVELGVNPMLELIEASADTQLTLARLTKLAAAKSPAAAALCALLAGLDGGGMVITIPEFEDFGPHWRLPPVSFKLKRLPLSQAITYYAQAYITLRKGLDNLGAGDLIARKLRPRIASSIRDGAHSLMVGAAAFITGKDSSQFKGMSDNDVIRQAQAAEHQLVPKTNLESRLAAHGDLHDLSKEDRALTVGSGSGYGPSHSEINKDHPDSLFYGLHRALAVEADRHILQTMQEVWQGRGSLFGDGARYESKTLVGHDLINGEARSQSDRARGVYRHDMPGSSFTQDAEANQATLRQNPAATKLLNLADLFISHPQDSSWWQGIFSSYIDSHSDEVINHISQRNQTLSHRAHSS